MALLPWVWPPEPGDGQPDAFAGFEGIRVDVARDGWVEVSVGPYNGFLPPDRIEEFVAAVRAAAAKRSDLHPAPDVPR